MENDENKTTFTLTSQKVFSIKVGLFLWFCAFLVPKSSTEKCWLWGHGAPPVFNQMTWDQVRRGFFEHVYQPTNPRRNLKNFMCPIVPFRSSQKWNLFHNSRTVTGLQYITGSGFQNHDINLKSSSKIITKVMTKKVKNLKAPISQAWLA